jgi:opacity protein-like surface antigen
MKSLLITTSMLAMLCAGAAQARDAEPAPANDAQADPRSDPQGGGFNDIIVTGRAGTKVRTKAETSYSVTNIGEEALRLQAPPA